MLGLMVLISLSVASKSFAHGTGYRQAALKAIPLEFFYSTGEAMSYREARVFSPNDEKFAAQSGRTDEKGRFAFVPDVAGLWRVIVRDEEGHQCEAKIDITEDFLSGNENITLNNENIDNAEIFMRAVSGVSIIFNIAMIVIIFRRKKHAY